VVEQVSAAAVVAETFARRVHVEWHTTATVTPPGQLFDGFVANKRDVLGTMLRSVLVGHWRYAHMRERGDNP
jgi:hypothetical protein